VPISVRIPDGPLPVLQRCGTSDWRVRAARQFVHRKQVTAKIMLIACPMLA
jgi:hypothetical protein